MKKVISLLLVISVLFCGALMLISCSDDDSDDPSDLTYAEYREMSSEEKTAHYYSFESVDAFYEWYNKAYAEWLEEQDREQITDEDVPVEIE